jgi:uncharacterized protein (DUF2062 family)
VALGVFWGITPFWGFQIWFVLFFAWLFKLNKALSVVASNISIPPMIPLILFLSFEAGRLWVGKGAVLILYNKNLTMDIIHKNIMQYIFGSFTLAAVCSLIAGLGTYIFVKKLKGKKV